MRGAGVEGDCRGAQRRKLMKALYLYWLASLVVLQGMDVAREERMGRVEGNEEKGKGEDIF